MKTVTVLAFLILFSPLLFIHSAFAYHVSLLMPNQNEDRWYDEGKKLQQLFYENEFDVDLFYAGEADAKLQDRQVRRVVDAGTDLIIIGPADSNKLASAIDYAHKNGVKVVSYDRLVLNTPNIDYYVTYNNKRIGALQAKYLVEALNLESGATKTIEFFHGSQEDNNSRYYYKGAMEVLQPYINNGTLLVRSGEIKPDDISVDSWHKDSALKRMEHIMNKAGYGPGDNRLDAVLSPTDTISKAVIQVLKQHGYCDENMPVITGQDGRLDALTAIKSREQAMTIYKEKERLCYEALYIAQCLKNNQYVKYNDAVTYHNGIRALDSLVIEPASVVDRYNVSSFMMVSQLFGNQFASL